MTFSNLSAKFIFCSFAHVCSVKYSYFKLISSVSFDFIRSPWVWLGCYLAFFSNMLAHVNFVSVLNFFEIFCICQHSLLLAKCQHFAWWLLSLPYKFLGMQQSKQIKSSLPCCLSIYFFYAESVLRMHEPFFFQMTTWSPLDNFSGFNVPGCENIYLLQCCWNFLSLDLNCLFWHNHLLPNFRTASSCDPVFSGWDFFFLEIPTVLLEFVLTWRTTVN